MQVGLAVQQGGGGGFQGSWVGFASTSKWMAVVTLVVVAVVALFLALLWCGMMVREGSYAGRDLWRKRKGKKRGLGWA